MKRKTNKKKASGSTGNTSISGWYKELDEATARYLGSLRPRPTKSAFLVMAAEDFLRSVGAMKK